MHPGNYRESSLQKADGSTNKRAFGRAVRTLPITEFENIVRTGFHRELAPWEIRDAALAQRVAEEVIAYDARPLLDEAFRHKVREAYQNACAFSGLRLINGGGRPEKRP